MKKFINAVDDALAESLEGFAAAYPDLVRLHPDPTFVCRAHKARHKVALISGGGSGHEPLHTGYVGHGMLDAACPGDIFVAPSPDQVLAAAEAVHAGRGVLFIVKNFSGDVTSFRTAAEMFDVDNALVLVNDDVAVESSPHSAGRRGIAGTVVVEKVVGSLAETGADLDACKALGDRVNRRTASMGVALTSCTEPAVGRPTFDIGDGDIEMGVGIHGEPGRRREPWKPADRIVDELVGAILEDLKPNRGDEALLMINGLGGTPLMEQYLLFGSARHRLQQAGITVSRSLVGNHTTSLEMAGASVTVCLLDDQIRHHWDSPVHTPALRWGR